MCIDDVTSKELQWHEVRQAREQALKYLRDIGVYEKVDEPEAMAQYQVTPVDTKWIDKKQSIGEGAHAHQITNCCKRNQQ